MQTLIHPNPEMTEYTFCQSSLSLMVRSECADASGWIVVKLMQDLRIVPHRFLTGG